MKLFVMHQYLMGSIDYLFSLSFTHAQALTFVHNIVPLSIV